MKTIQMTIDERLLKLVDKMSRARKTNRSAFIREALEAEIRRQRVREDEARHAAGRQPVSRCEFGRARLDGFGFVSTPGLRGKLAQRDEESIRLRKIPFHDDRFERWSTRIIQIARKPASKGTRILEGHGRISKHPLRRACEATRVIVSARTSR